MKTFDLMFCCLGNGITVCDRRQEESGDYKTVAHIAEWGGLRIRDKRLRNDLEAFARLQAQAASKADKERARFFRLPYAAQYELWYESMTLSQQLHDRNTWPVEKSPEWLYSQYIRNSNRKHGYEMPTA